MIADTIAPILAACNCTSQLPSSSNKKVDYKKVVFIYIVNHLLIECQIFSEIIDTAFSSKPAGNSDMIYSNICLIYYI